MLYVCPTFDKNNFGIREKASNADTGPEFLFASLKPETL